MYDHFKTRMSHKGTYMGETMRKQSEHVVNATWMNSVSTRPVCIKVIDSGLPPEFHCVEEFDETLWAHIEPHNKFNVTKDEQDHYLTFPPGVIHEHPEIKIGSYVCIPNVDNELEWWIIVYIDNDNELRKCQILQCNWIFKWVFEGKIYKCLGCQRVANSYNSGSWSGDIFGFVDNIVSAWLPTNSDTCTIGYNQRMIVSDKGRHVPLVWKISKIEDTVPVGITKFRFTQETFDPIHDNAELGLANYYDDNLPEDPKPIGDEVPKSEFNIKYNGKNPTVKVGSSKTFTSSAQNISWSVIDDNGTYLETNDKYNIAIENDILKLKVTRDYDLVGKVITITAKNDNDEIAETKVEIIS